MTIKLKKIICILLSCLILCNTCVTTYADAGTAALLVSAGGFDFAAMGATTATIGSIALPVVVVIAIVLVSAYGVETYLNKNADTWVEKKAFMQSKIMEYKTHLGVSLNELMSNMVTGLTVTSAGVIEFTNTCSSYWNDFYTWLVSSNVVYSQAPTGGAYLGSQQVLDITNVTIYTTAYNSTYKYKKFFTNDGSKIYSLYFSANNTILLFTTSSAIYANYSRDGLTWLGNSANMGNNIIGITGENVDISPWGKCYLISNDVTNSFNDGLRDNFNNIDGIISGVELTSSSALAWILAHLKGISISDIPALGNALVGNPSQVIDDALALDPSIADELEVPAGTVVDPVDYIGIIDDIIGGEETTPIDGVDVPLPIVIDPTVDPVDDTTFDPVPEPLPDVGDTLTGSYMFDLTSIFPFCLPFDFLYLIKTLNAEPTAPKITVPLHFANVVNYDFTIDLSMFNGVANILRMGETILFISGLIWFTRSLIIRS